MTVCASRASRVVSLAILNHGAIIGALSSF
jgi:hypothetical protein